MDLDTTTDVHEEFTEDLEPATVDIPPSDVPDATLANTMPARRAAESLPAPKSASDSNAAANEERIRAGAAERGAAGSERIHADAPEPSAAGSERIRAGAAEPGAAGPERILARKVAALDDSERITTHGAESPAAASERITARDARDSEPAPVNLQRFVARERREPFVSEPAKAAPITAITIDVPLTDPTVAPTPATPPRKPITLRAVEKSRLAMSPGTVLCDRYLLEQVIGCGGTAIVFRARDMLSAKGTAPNIQVAVKTPRPELGDPARAAKRLKHEFEHARLLSHPSIVKVLDLHEEQGQCFMTMELVQGKLLSQMLRDWTMMPPALAYKILRQCSEALSYAHGQNVVHGDFKPGNVFITPQEGVRIVDFGTAAGPSANDSRIPAGTPTYASPEVLSGETPDARDDVFSFACVAYEVLTGQHPFGRLSSLQARDEAKIPPRAWNLSTSQWLSLLSALSWKREQRPASVEELFTRLSPDLPIAAPAPVHVDPEEVVPAELPAELMPKQRSWGFFAFLACALLVTFLAFQHRRAPDPASSAPAPVIAPAAATLPPAPLQAAPEAKQEEPAAPASATKEEAAPEAAAPVQAAPAAASKPARPAATMSEISFESSSIVTSESSVAAVFLVKRSQPLRDRVSVSWRAVSGTADAGIDFASSAAGTVTFADGQAQRAIYVPLRNDLLKEPDETFYVELLSPKSARLGKTSRTEAIIRDDD